MDAKISVILFVLLNIVSSNDIEFENFKPDPSIKSEDFLDFGTLRLKKVSKNHYTISGELELLENSGNEKEIHVEIKNKKNGEVLVSTRKKLCDFAETDELIWPDLKKKSNFSDSCPISKGIYSIDGYEIDEKKFSNAPAGEYVARLTFYENDKALTAVDVICNLKI